MIMNKRLSILTVAALFLSTAALTFISCDKDDDTIPEIDPSTITTIIELVSGGNQTDIAGATLENAIEVLVKDLDGNPYEGEVVYFAVTQGSVSETTVTTGVNGKASVKWTLGDLEGPQTLIITGTKTLTVAPISVIATAEYRPEIGDYYKGGLIFYIDATKKHGLVCAYSDQSADAEWGCSETAVPGADGTAIGSGAQNTIDIVEKCGGYDIAAAECDDLTYFSYSDWFLPSKDELNLLYEKKAIINTAFEEVSGSPLNDAYYWSSSETSADAAWAQNFVTGEQVSGYKDNTVSVRAIKVF
jgi:uncharacterized protein DUF1566